MTSPTDEAPEAPVLRPEKQSDTSAGMAASSSFGWGAVGTIAAIMLLPWFQARFGVDDDAGRTAIAGAIVTLSGAAGTWFTTYILPARFGGGRR